MRFLAIATLIIAAVACGGPRVVSSELAPRANLSSYKTFDFYKVEASGDTIPELFRKRTGQMEEAIAAELVKRGYTRSSNDPDLLVNIGVVVKEKVQTRTTSFPQDAPIYIGQRNYHWESEEKEVGRYRLGTATIDLVDRKSNSLVWKSVVEDVIPEKESRVEAAINKGVERMFKKFPN